MDPAQVLGELEELGTAQNRKVYARHGVHEPLFGVGYADLDELRKRIGVDQGLAEELWRSGNHDARVLATMVADPDHVAEETLEAWREGLDDYVLTDAFSKLVARTPFAREKTEEWTTSKHEWTGQAGWNLLAQLAMRGSLPDDYFAPYLERIERDVHRSANRIRHSMVMALCSIGMRSGTLEKEAVAAARRIGEVEVDHGETGCRTPSPEAYIRRARERRAAMARKRSAKKAGKKKAARKKTAKTKASKGGAAKKPAEKPAAGGASRSGKAGERAGGRDQTKR